MLELGINLMFYHILRLYHSLVYDVIKLDPDYLRQDNRQVLVLDHSLASND